MAEGGVGKSLLQSILQEDFDTFTSILSTAQPDEINGFHGFPHDTTCLMAACQKGLSPFVQLLLESEAQADAVNPVRKVGAIHVAIQNGRLSLMDVLLRFGADVNLVDDVGRTALHYLISRWNPTVVTSQWWSTFDLLLSHPQIDVNVEDNNETSPLELAVRKNIPKLVAKLVQAGAILTDNVREAMQEFTPDLLVKYPADDQLTNNNPAEMNSDTFLKELWRSLRKNDMDTFRQLIALMGTRNFGVNLSMSEATQNPTLMQYSCDSHNLAAVELLLAAGIDPNQNSFQNSWSPLLIAAQHGDTAILRLLVCHPKIQLDAVDHAQSGLTALHKVARRVHVDKSKYLACLRLLLSQAAHADETFSGTSVNVNAQDLCGNTALHYAAISGVEDGVKELLFHGAYLGIKNCLGETAVERILPSTLEMFLDACVNGNSEEISSQNLAITFDYRILAPPQRSVTELGVVYSAASHSEHATQAVSLQPIVEEDIMLPECEALWHLSCSSKHRYLLKHPLLTSFLMLKWHNIRFFYFINVFVYMLAVSVLTTYMLLLNTNSELAADTVRFMNVLWYVLWILVITLFVRELFQLGIAPLRYLLSLENYVELVMLGCTSVVLVQWQQAQSWRHLAAISVLLAWMEALLLLGRHPKLSTFVTMFTTVSNTFLRLLVWYSLLVVGFALSFYLLFRSDGEEEAAFSTVSQSLLKVSAMMTGELEFGDLPFDGYPVTSRAVFLAFLFLITIVLLALLSGVAVSDIQAIQNHAEIIGYVNRVELISYMESMLLGDPFHFLAHWPTLRWIRRCPSFNPVGKMVRRQPLRTIFRAARVVLFHQCLPNKTFTAYPNQKTTPVSITVGQQILMVQKTCSCHSTFRMSDSILQSASQRIQEKQRSDSSVDILVKIEKLDTMVTTLHDQNLKLIQLLQNSLGNKPSD